MTRQRPAPTEPSIEVGLRERKKQRTRQHIADTAAGLFAEQGYDNVTVADVARRAEVAEQTVYNYFASKEQLVTDRENRIQDRLCELIRGRPRGTTPAAAVRDFVVDSVTAIRRISPEVWRGELGHLSAMSPSVHRLALELIDRQALALAQVIAETSDVTPEVARLQGIALSGVYHVLIDEAGRPTREGQTQARIARELSATVAALLHELDRWFGPPQRAQR